MIAYASRTGTRRNLAALRQAGWRLMVSAKGVLRTEGFAYALDNGAWHCFQHRLPFDEAAFLAAYRKLGSGADFCVLPDIVAGGLRSLEFSLNWAPRLGECPNYLAVQDGMSVSDVAPVLNGIAGIFVGGTSEWKERSLPTWGMLARKYGVALHVGRVNTARRIHLCRAARATSFDGSSVSRYAVTLPKLESARQQKELPWDYCLSSST
jgi:hypothetical protein